MTKMMRGYGTGCDITDHVAGTRHYADYDHLLRGAELSSALIASNPAPAPPLVNPAADFRPLIRNGWRAPHVWVDDAATESVLDWYGHDYVLLLGPQCDLASWQGAVDSLPDGGVPLTVRQLPDGRDIEPYGRDGVVLVRPDAVIAQHLSGAGEPTDLSTITRYIPSLNR